MTKWINNGGIYMIPRPDKVDRERIRREMAELEQKIQEAEAYHAARKGRTA